VRQKSIKICFAFFPPAFARRLAVIQSGGGFCHHAARFRSLCLLTIAAAIILPVEIRTPAARFG
jgi:hypothetical protein